MGTLGCIRVLDERQDAGAMLHRPRLTGDLAATGADVCAGLVDIFDFQGNMPVAVAQLVFFHAPVVGQLDHAVVRLVAVADEGQGELAFRIILAAQQGHAQHLGIEGDGFFHVADAQHGMQQSHVRVLLIGSACGHAESKTPAQGRGRSGSGTPAYQNWVRPLPAAMRMRSALSLMKPPASA